MGTAKDLFKYPVYKYINYGQFMRIYPESAVHNIWQWQVHHYIQQQWVKRNKLKFKEIEHLQKLFVIPTQMHIDLHNSIRNFERKWGVKREELIYGVHNC